MNIHRFIFRLDFEPCYQMIDAPGTVMQIIKSVGEDHWQQIGPTNNAHQIAASRVLKDRPKREAASFTAELTSLSGDIELEGGVTWEKLCDSDYLKTVDRTCEELMARFDISKVKRCGARLLATGGGAGATDFIEAYTGRFQNQFVPARLRKGLKVTDCAVHLIGDLEHDVKYRFLTGPGEQTDLRKFFNQIALSDGDLPSQVHAYSIDLDLYQLNINFRGTRLARWMRAKDQFVKNFVEISDFVSTGAAENAGN